MKHKKVLLVFVLLLLVDAADLYYEINSVKVKIVPILKLGAYFLLIKSIFHKLNIKFAKKAITIIFSMVVLLNIILIYNVVWLDSIKVNDDIERIIYLLYGLAIIGICIATTNYNFRYDTKKSVYFLYVIFALSLSDFSWFMGYYLNAQIAFYLDILFYIISLYYLINYTFDTTEKDDNIREKHLS